jgi:hypothetical protein
MLAVSKTKNKNREIPSSRRVMASFVSIGNLAEQDAVPRGRSSVKILRIDHLVLSDTIEIN